MEKLMKKNLKKILINGLNQIRQKLFILQNLKIFIGKKRKKLLKNNLRMIYFNIILKKSLKLLKKLLKQFGQQLMFLRQINQNEEKITKNKLKTFLD